MIAELRTRTQTQGELKMTTTITFTKDQIQAMAESDTPQAPRYPANCIPATEARKGEKVTTHLDLNGTGMGYLVDGIVYVTTGSYWAMDATKDFLPMLSFDRDGGRGYLNKARTL